MKNPDPSIVARVPMAPVVKGAVWPLPGALIATSTGSLVPTEGARAFGARRGVTRLTIGPTLGPGGRVVAPLDGHVLGYLPWTRSRDDQPEVALFLRCGDLIVGLGCLREFISAAVLAKNAPVHAGMPVGSVEISLHFFMLKAQTGVTDGDFLSMARHLGLVWRTPKPGFADGSSPQPPAGLLNPTEFLRAAERERRSDQVGTRPCSVCGCDVKMWGALPHSMDALPDALLLCSNCNDGHGSCVIRPDDPLYETISKRELVDAPTFEFDTPRARETERVAVSMYVKAHERTGNVFRPPDITTAADDVFEGIYAFRQIPPKIRRGDGWVPYIDSWLRIRDLLSEAAE